MLAEAAVLSGPDSYYRLKVSVDGEQIQCFVDGVQVFSVRDARAAKGGKIGLTADCPTQFADVRVSVDRGTEHAMREQEERERQRIHRLQASYPGMKLWRKIDLRDFGGSRPDPVRASDGHRRVADRYPPGTEAGGPGFLRPHQLSDCHRSFRECVVAARRTVGERSGAWKDQRRPAMSGVRYRRGWL